MKNLSVNIQKYLRVTGEAYSELENYIKALGNRVEELEGTSVTGNLFDPRVHTYRFIDKTTGYKVSAEDVDNMIDIYEEEVNNYIAINRSPSLNAIVEEHAVGFNIKPSTFKYIINEYLESKKDK